MMTIKELLAQPESKTLEFKRDISSMHPILKTIVAFANTAGGTLIIGQSADGTLKGVEDIFKTEEKLANAIADNILPGILPEIEVLTQLGKNLILIKVPYWKGPFYLKKEGTPKGIYIRLGSTSRPINLTMLEEIKRLSMNTSFDQQPIIGLDTKSVDMEKVKEVFKPKININQSSLLSMGILVPYLNKIVPSIGGLILFGKKEEKEHFFPYAKAKCARFLGKDKKTIIDQYEVEESLLQGVLKILAFIKRNTRLEGKIEYLQREDTPEYPPVAIREALINAIVHSDYSVIGSNIQIAIFDDRLEIQNPGMLPFGFTLEDLKLGLSRTRNRVLARVFRNLNLMEEWGSGYQRIIAICKSGNYPEPKWEELPSFIRVTFYSRMTKKRIKNTISSRQKAILVVLKKSKPLPFRDIFKKIKLDISERTLRYELAALKKQNLLSSEGKGRNIVWFKKTEYK